MGVAAKPGPQIEAASPSQPAAHSAAVAAAGPAVVFARAAVVPGLRAGEGSQGAEAAEAGREEGSGRAGGAGGGRLPGSVGAARWLGRIPRGPGGGGESPARPWRTTRNWTTNGSRILRTKAATWRYSGVCGLRPRRDAGFVRSRAGAAAGMALGGRASGRDAGAAPGSLCRACSASAGDSARARRVRPRPVLPSRPDTSEGSRNIGCGGGPAAAEAPALLRPRRQASRAEGDGGASGDLVTSQGLRRFHIQEVFLITPTLVLLQRPNYRSQLLRWKEKKKAPPPLAAVLVMLAVPSSGLGFTLVLADSRCSSRCALFRQRIAYPQPLI